MASHPARMCMSGESSYEVQVLGNDGWAIQAFFDDWDLAQAAARRTHDTGRYRVVRIAEVAWNPAKGEFDTRAVHRVGLIERAADPDTASRRDTGPPRRDPAPARPKARAPSRPARSGPAHGTSPSSRRTRRTTLPMGALLLVASILASYVGVKLYLGL